MTQPRRGSHDGHEFHRNILVCRGWFFFALFALFRSSLSIGLLERPLVVGFFWGMLFGNMQASLSCAIFYELLWLDFLPVGTFIPPHMTAATFSCLLLVTHFGLDEPPFVFLALIAGLPMAWLGARLDRTMRDRLNRSYNGVLQWVRKPVGENVPTQLILRTLIGKALVFWLFFIILNGLLALAVGSILMDYSGQIASLKLEWYQFWISASIGGLLALRLRSLYLSVGAGAIVFGILRYIGIF
jgi:PTS system mannose-specific IIC component